ncbi:dimethylaniline monooxygenase [N-oxide-forming] 2-like isoform X1 [Mytilus galloprovincialis]|uniref:dimethylaniline monooxygenase [N-oxide-forming] 2-like isoform X1 n=2 Tax=Mytilus galloprovincialis TaxID=29158 RepID=UPI003F7B9B99
MNMTKKKVCVIGAGVAGLAGIKNSLDEGMEPVCFEKDDEVGGLWNYKDESKEGDPSIYNSCSINTSKEMTCYSDFPIPKEFPNFMAHRHFKRYLQLYAEHFKLRNYIRFRHMIMRVEQAEDFEESGRWVVTYKNLATNSTNKDIFDCVMVCNGHLHEPFIPTFKGIANFTGRVLHTHDYKDFRGFEGKRVLVIGIGNSASDVASELSRHAEHVYMSTRTGTYVIQRTTDQGVPFDHKAMTRYGLTVPFWLMKPFAFKRLNSRFDHTKYSLAPNGKFGLSVVTISDDLPTRILYGTITVKPNVKEFAANSVTFEDGTTADNLDAIILATGFKFSFPFLKDSIVRIENHFPYLHELVFPVDLSRPTLAIIGLVQPFGALPPILEMQTRWAARVFSGNCQLPPASVMKLMATKKHEFMKNHFPESPKYCLQIHAVTYVDKIAGLIGCKPNLTKYFFTAPILWSKLFFGPAAPPQWRLDGPGKWDGARQAIEQVDEKTWYPLQTRRAGEGTTKGLYDGWIWLISRSVLFSSAIYGLYCLKTQKDISIDSIRSLPTQAISLLTKWSS